MTRLKMKLTAVVELLADAKRWGRRCGTAIDEGLK
jgi:hypothetical protein